MGVRVLEQILGSGSNLRPVQKLTLLVMASLANQDGLVSISIVRLAFRVGTSLCTQRAALKALHLTGLVTQIKTAVCGRPAVYELNLNKLLASAPGRPRLEPGL